MKYLVLAFLAIVYIQCQGIPAHNPGTTNCVATTTCLKTGGTGCGNSSISAKYCGDPAQYCDYLNSQNCVAKKTVGGTCNSTYLSADCSNSYCLTGVCTAYPTYTTTAAPTVAIAYETQACSLATGPYCAAGLSCVSSVCQKYFANTASCNSALDCTPGSVCVGGACATQTSTKVVGAACTADSDCNSQVQNALCFCSSVGGSTGLCGVPDAINGLAFTAAAVTNCQALVNQYKNGGTITASNSNTAAQNFGCCTSCAYTNGPSAVTSAWAGNNNLVAPYGSISICVYTPPTTCANPTTTGPTKASATSVIASLFLTVLALLF